jgi:K+-sensing histidine kinase KdpD
MQILYIGLPKILVRLLCTLITYTCCWELMKLVASRSSVSLLFVMQVKVEQFVSGSHKEVMTALVVLLPSNYCCGDLSALS